jgi:hypothetical protein
MGATFSVVSTGFSVGADGGTGVTALTQSGWLTVAAQAFEIADAGGMPGAHSTATLSPTKARVQLSCLDADGCTITMGEGAGAGDGMQVEITNMGANHCDFADTPGVTELSGAIELGQYDYLLLSYETDRWVQRGRSDN